MPKGFSVEMGGAIVIPHWDVLQFVIFAALFVVVAYADLVDNFPLLIVALLLMVALYALSYYSYRKLKPRYEYEPKSTIPSHPVA